MYKIHFLLVLLVAALSTENSYAQDSTASFMPQSISVEEMVGNKQQYFQILVNKVYVEEKKIGMLSISSYAANEKFAPGENEFQNTTLIYHHIFSGVSINSGTSFTSAEGLYNFVGLQYLYQSKSFSVIYMPGYYFINIHKISNLALLEFMPDLDENWSVYSRLQLHYNHNLENGKHFRSYVYSRLGLTYKYFSFGLAYNYDSYSADKNIKNNYGIFLKWNL